ncbi:uncharacterized protein [Bemisia tabaci]|uniref:uncharacterized protein n=1 Tax=Bemisia tabaci TaxID=7038 RepID=UPI003B288499
MTINAAGEILPPTVIFKYVRVPKTILESVPSDWGAGVADSGWMTAKGFYEFMVNIFNDWVEKRGIKEPELFFVDGHKSHVTYQLRKFCEENKIILITLPPNTTEHDGNEQICSSS